MVRFACCIMLFFLNVNYVAAFDLYDNSSYKNNQQYQDSLKKYSNGLSLDNFDSYFDKMRNKKGNNTDCDNIITPIKPGQMITVVSGYSGVKSVAISRDLHVAGKNYTLTRYNHTWLQNSIKNYFNTVKTAAQTCSTPDPKAYSYGVDSGDMLQKMQQLLHSCEPSKPWVVLGQGRQKDTKVLRISINKAQTELNLNKNPHLSKAVKSAIYDNLLWLFPKVIENTKNCMSNSTGR